MSEPIIDTTQIMMTPQEAAAYAHVTRQAIYLAMIKGLLKSEKRGGRKFITQYDLDEYRLNKYNRQRKTGSGEHVFNIDRGLFSVPQICSILSAKLNVKISAQRIYYCLRKGYLPSYRHGSYWVIKLEDAEKFMVTEQKYLQKRELKSA